MREPAFRFGEVGVDDGVLKMDSEDQIVEVTTRGLRTPDPPKELGLGLWIPNFGKACDFGIWTFWTESPSPS